MKVDLTFKSPMEIALGENGALAIIRVRGDLVEPGATAAGIDKKEYYELTIEQVAAQGATAWIDLSAAGLSLKPRLIPKDDVKSITLRDAQPDALGELTKEVKTLISEVAALAKKMESQQTSLKATDSVLKQLKKAVEGQLIPKTDAGKRGAK
jgi:hypothetical protein